MRLIYRATHNVAEGAGAASLAAMLKEASAMRGRKVGLIFTMAIWSEPADGVKSLYPAAGGSDHGFGPVSAACISMLDKWDH